MNLAFDILGLLALALCLGGMVFFSAIVAPMVFINLDEINAGKLIRATFPYYYLYVILTATTATVVYIDELPFAAAGFASAALSSLYARLVLMGKINVARDAMIAGEEIASHLFDRLHKLSVRLNSFGLLAVIAATIYIGIKG